MLARKHLLEHLGDDGITSIDLTDTYFHISITPCHGRHLHFSVVEGAQCIFLLFRYSLALHTFSNCVETELNPFRERGVQILTYIDDRLILAFAAGSHSSRGSSDASHYASGVQSGKEHDTAESADAISRPAPRLM